MNTNSGPTKSIDQRVVIELTRTLVERPSENPPGEEAWVASAIVEWLENSSVDFDVEVTDVHPDRPNVVARAGNPANGSVLLSGHMDVVPAEPSQWNGDPYVLRERDGRLVGRGTADMKAALAAKLLAAEAYLTNSDDPGEVVLGLVIDEEGNAAGTRALIEEGMDVDCAIIGEPTNLQVCIAQKGLARYQITVTGESAHTGTPDEGVDAIRAAGRLLAAFESLDAELRDSTMHELLTPETLTVTEIEGGIAPNVVADRVEIGLDWRILPGKTATPERVERTIKDVIATTDFDTEVTVELERTLFARPAEIPVDHELVDTLVAAASDVGTESTPVGFNAGTDARFLVHDATVPTVLFGPGSIENDAHTVDESISIDDLHITALTYTRALERLLDR